MDSGDACLRGNDDFVIYDTLQETDIHELEHPDDRLIRGYEAYFPNPSFDAYPGAAWSHTGRYLAFLNRTLGLYEDFNLSIYDRVADRYLDTEWVNAEIANHKAMQWSPQADKLLFWVIGRISGEDQPDDDYRTLRSLIIFDANTETFSWADQPFNLSPRGIERVGKWSPDGLGYLFTDLDDTLYYVDINTGVSTALDDHVSRIVAWNSTLCRDANGIGEQNPNDCSHSD